MKTSTIKNKAKSFGVVLFWIFIWQVLSTFISEEILFVSPLKVIPQIFVNLSDGVFWRALISTLSKISLGFIVGFVIGTALATLSYKFKVVRELLYPLILFLKSVPVVSFIILILFFMSSERLPIFISVIIVIPIIYLNVYEGLINVDKKYLNMAKVFDVGILKEISYIYIPSLKGYIQSGLELSVGMAWKSGLAAEVIALPKYGIGTLIYNCKIYLDTVNLFSYTILAVVVAFLFEKLVLYIFRRIAR
ncbi:NitT/TauT family transport system permease protein [Anaerosphaera aminiphila DSM 21120]|uniref:NitT/TauT family transport system permease protein n=1 Tax=Anaerosphaera aminiphila DSM 21120 TaxID=1120995 RepID=A0A1M5Q9P1_9FIRM|nr:ABC transporter permease subunit [Anaerosphaera aminiphila]SHH10678.1 NitT/TauT family transport system permease protein [Anaerosphaera aminiphila DSM 21120]